MINFRLYSLDKFGGTYFLKKKPLIHLRGIAKKSMVFFSLYAGVHGFPFG